MQILSFVYRIALEDRKKNFRNVVGKNNECHSPQYGREAAYRAEDAVKK